MNIDKNIVARAMDKAGEEPITEADWTEGTGTRVRLIKDVYQATILEALAATDWTSQKKRAQLELATDVENLTTFYYMYDIPIDCAKPCALSNDDTYLVEGDYLYTNTQNAILIYISDGFDNEDRPNDDYNFYATPNLDPLLSEYIETVLAQKIVLKLTGDITKYQLLYSEARLMENRAIKASVAHGHNKDKGNPYWGDTLGLPNYGGN